MSSDCPSHLNPSFWEFANSGDENPVVVILQTGFRVACDRKVGPYSGIPATSSANTSGLNVMIGGVQKGIPWTEIAAIYPQQPMARIPSIRNIVDSQLSPLFSAANGWIDNYIQQTSGRATNVSQFRDFNLGKAFRQATLENAFAVEELRPAKLPLSQMGLTEFRDFEVMPVNAITYKNVFFVQRGRLTASLAFHEMVHVVQWEELGAENFLLAYGIGLKAWGYEASPLEAMAYNLEIFFNAHQLPIDTESYIREQSRLIFASPLEHPASALNIP